MYFFAMIWKRRYEKIAAIVNPTNKPYQIPSAFKSVYKAKYIHNGKPITQYEIKEIHIGIFTSCKPLKAHKAVTCIPSEI